MYRITAEPSAFRPDEVMWRVHKQYTFFGFRIPMHWEYVSTYKTKDEAIAATKALISAGGPYYIKE